MQALEHFSSVATFAAAAAAAADLPQSFLLLAIAAR